MSYEDHFFRPPRRRPARSRITGPPGRLPARLLAAALALVTAVALTGCGGTDSDGSGSGGLEKTRLTVGLLPVPEGAPLYIAIQRGLFKAEGLEVTPQFIQTGAAAVPLLRSGKLDISLTNYVAALLAQEQSGGAVKWKFVADAYQGEKGAFVVGVAADSPIRSAQDLTGKKIAVPGLKSIATLAVSASLRAAGIADDSVQYVEMAFPQMLPALEAGRVDAAWLAEPFISQLNRQGGRTVLDTMDPGGPTKNLPISGWGVLGDYADEHPNTVAAFQRAMARAQRMAAEDRSLVARTLPTFVKGLDAQTAQVVTLGSFPTSQNPTRLQRLAGLMGNYGYLRNPGGLNIPAMQVSGP
ncbi:ABC transporter substrate-binding protein [Thermomonospora cellulosilytica]|uniref:NitT/TauT family transport system substrate-binding protein n=1 Tax=Thermomonospora cellulosilytica TaxID=1411118 RepID=A0A7W3MTN6_9ACTN|nr:ABC transporter substrate-binding protein [Thermomonospora cellulosilytica]MBA9001703.1 NitT/TauT family transport system substrate-binding protein [Thermomonospora cellulosilytica]